MKKGIILKGVGGKYEVKTEEGLVSCTLRGRLRLEKQRVLVGDRVRISIQNGQGAVEHILPRQTELIRPPIANVEQVAAVFAVEKPLPSLVVLDRILIHAQLAGLEPMLVINKGDLNFRRAEQLKAMYGDIPYPALITSAKEGWGFNSLKNLFQGRISTFAGPSGTGKSSLLNMLVPGLNLETQKLSTRAERGKHTTRSVQLLPLPWGGYLADTPGFSQLSLAGNSAEDLQYAFPEMRKYLGLCQFRGCLHDQEPNCAVKQAVQAGTILSHRYEHYLLFLEEAALRY